MRRARRRKKNSTVGAAESTRSRGAAAEEAAARFLRSHGHKILARNFSTTAGEVDIIAADGTTICFIEVRSRGSGEFGPPHASVRGAKQKRIRSAAATYLRRKRLGAPLCRFDVVSMVLAPGQKPGWEIEWLRNAF